MKKLPPNLTTTAVHLATGLITLQEAAALHGLPLEDLVSTLDDPEFVAGVEAEVARLRIDGRTAELRANKLLDALLTRLEEEIPTAGAATAVRIGELLVRLSGLVERRAAQLRYENADSQQGHFEINIVIPNSDGSTTHISSHPKPPEQGAIPMGQAQRVRDDA